MSYRVEWAKSALRELHALRNSTALRITRATRELGDVPRPVGCKKLKGFKDLWRIRVGQYRVLYVIADEIRLVRVERVADRKDVYC